ncbi:MAG: site-specific integrase [Gemmataceae bacterium]|nr:site-specific integrase [Gemmataceae bacterium]
MASLSKDPSGRYRVQFEDPATGVRKTLRLPCKDKKTAEGVRVHIEHLLLAKMTGTAPPPATAAWLANLTEPLKSRLARVGLVDQPKPDLTLRQFVADYLRLREHELKPSTKKTLHLALTDLFRYVDPDTPLRQVSPLQADRLRTSLLATLARSTANKRTAILKQIFQAAVERRLIERNPFGHIKGLTVLGERHRRQFIPAELVQRVLEVIPCPQLRLVVALARWGGLRVPSEVFALRWSDINLPEGRMVVRSPKTERIAGREARVVPIFPELRPFLEQLWDSLPEGAPDQVITRYRTQPQLAAVLHRWCLIAGVKPWPRLYHNLRVSRATELADRFPSHVCAAWLGHTERIADQCYRQVTDEHFHRATQELTDAKSDAKSDARSALQDRADKSKEEQNPTQDNGSNSLALVSVYNSRGLENPVAGPVRIQLRMMANSWGVGRRPSGGMDISSMVV